MKQVATSAVGFVRGLIGPCTFAAAAISDPLHWLKSCGLVSEGWQWDISAEFRQFMFLGVAVVWAFIWYHKERVRHEMTGSRASSQRKLSQKQIQILRQAASEVIPQNDADFSVCFETSSLETRIYAQQFVEALNSGGWDISSDSIFFGGNGGPIKKGLRFMVPLRPSPAVLAVADRFEIALDDAGIRYERVVIEINGLRFWVHHADDLKI